MISDHNVRVLCAVRHVSIRSEQEHPTLDDMARAGHDYFIRGERSYQFIPQIDYGGYISYLQEVPEGEQPDVLIVDNGLLYFEQLESEFGDLNDLGSAVPLMDKMNSYPVEMICASYAALRELLVATLKHTAWEPHILLTHIWDELLPVHPNLIMMHKELVQILERSIRDEFPSIISVEKLDYSQTYGSESRMCVESIVPALDKLLRK